MYRNTQKRQQGFLLPLAIFIVVVMGVFALTISRNTIQTGTSATLEAISVQAFYAAESGAQRGMQSLFYPDASSRQQVDTRCVGLNTTHTFTVPGLKACSAVVTCTCVFQDSTSCGPINAANYAAAAGVNRLTTFYKISSAATCGSGNLKATRTIEAGSFLKQE
jgi:MSHA biogenesis protein MshP